MSSKTKLQCGVLQFRGNSRHNLEASSFLEFDTYGFKAYTLFSFFEAFKRDEAHTIHMQLDSYMVRQLIVGLERVEVNAKENLTLHTGGSQTSKTLTLNKSDKGDIFLNVSHEDKKFSFSFTAIQTKAMVASLTTLVNRLEEMVIEREVEKSMKAIRLPLERKKEAETKQLWERVFSLLNTTQNTTKA